MSKSVVELELKRDQLLSNQRTVSDKFNEVLTKKGGLNDSSTMVRKNLLAAIAVAQQPGFFEYYKVPDEVKTIEVQNELKKLTMQIKRVQKEIDQVRAGKGWWLMCWSKVGMEEGVYEAQQIN